MLQDELGPLKSEQTARIVLRDTTLYVHIASVVAIYAAEGQAGDNADLVASIRAFAIVLTAVICSIYVSNDFYVSRLAHFASTYGSELMKAWETEHRKGVRYRLQKLLRATAILTVFPGWATLQLMPVIRAGLDLLAWIGFVSWLLVVGATVVFLTVDYGRRTV